MYKHILIPTDGSVLSKLALGEGVALAKALDARVTVLTVTTPFHVITGNPVMLADTPERYKEHMAAIAWQYLDEGTKVAAAAEVASSSADLVDGLAGQAAAERAGPFGDVPCAHADHHVAVGGTPVGWHELDQQLVEVR